MVNKIFEVFILSTTKRKKYGKNVAETRQMDTKKNRHVLLKTIDEYKSKLL